MGMGTGIVLFILGAIIAFALDITVDWADLDMIGYLLMGAGLVVFVISLILVLRKRSTTETVRHIDAGGEQRTQHEVRTDGDDRYL